MADDLPDMPSVGVPLADDYTAPTPSAPSSGGRRYGGQFAQLEPLANYWSDYYGLDRNVFNAMIDKESSWVPSTIGKAQEVGLGQILPSTGVDIQKQLGKLNFNDPNDNLRAAAYHLRKQFDSPAGAGDYGKALTMYNRGHLVDDRSYATDVLQRANATQLATTGSVAPVPQPVLPITSGSNVPGTNLVAGPQLGFVNTNLLSPQQQASAGAVSPTVVSQSGPSGGTGAGGTSSGAGGPSGSPSGDPNGPDARSRAIAQAFADRMKQGGQGNGWQMLAMAAALLKGYQFYSSYDPKAYYPRLNYAGPVSTGAPATPVPMHGWESFGGRVAPEVALRRPPIIPPTS